VTVLKVWQLDGFLPLSRNARDRAHWAKRKKEKQVILDMIGTAPAAARQVEGRRQVTIVFAKNAGPLSDSDNCTARLKDILDALVLAGWLADDAPRWCAVEASEERGPKGTTITLFDLGQAEEAA